MLTYRDIVKKSLYKDILKKMSLYIDIVYTQRYF